MKHAVTQGGDANSIADGIAFLSQLLDRPIGDFSIAMTHAEKLVEQRLKTLQRFINPGNPPDLLENFTRAAQLTQMCHELCKANLPLIEHAKAISSYSKSDLFAIACHDLNAKNESQMPETSLFIQRRTEAAILKGLENPSDTRTINAIIDDEFVDTPVGSVFVARAYATTLLLYTDTLEYMRFAFVSAATISVISRGIFYVGIVEEKGGELASVARRKALKNKMDGAPAEIAGAAPVIGEYLGHVMSILDTLHLLWDQEAALQRMHEAMLEGYDLAAKFVDTYLGALVAWSDWANSVHRALHDTIRSDSALFRIRDVRILKLIADAAN